MNTINTYTIKELKEEFPNAYEKAFERYKQEQSEDVPWSEEIMESMKATFSHAGIRLTDYSLGAYCYSYVKFGMHENTSNLEGRKAYNWLKLTFDLKSVSRVNYKNHLGKKSVRYDFTKLKGESWSCEFTGYCADYDFLEDLFMSVYDGMNLKDAFHALADKYCRLVENEIEYNQSEEAFLEHCEANDLEFLDDDRIV